MIRIKVWVTGVFNLGTQSDPALAVFGLKTSLHAQICVYLTGGIYISALALELKAWNQRIPLQARQAYHYVAF